MALTAVIVALTPAAASARQSATHLRSFRDCPQCSEMVVLPAGRFTMGSPVSEPGRHDDESPQTDIKVASFAIGRTDVTRAEWAAYVAATDRPDGLGCAYSGLPKEQAATASWRHLGFAQGDDEPVVCVSWAEAQGYVDWLSRKTGRRYRLPTEAEWEYAARAGSTTAYPWGDRASHDLANYGADTCCTGATSGRDVWENTSPVGSFAPNAFGLYDMIGNVWQWTEDCYTPTLAGRPRDASAVSAPDCKFRVARGGTWGDTPALIRSASRNYAPPPGLMVKDYRSAGFGLRVVTDALGGRADDASVKASGSVGARDAGEIHMALDGMQAAWNRHDMKAFVSWMTDDVEWVNVVGMCWRGKAQVFLAHERMHETTFKNRQWNNAEMTELRQVAPAVVIVTQAVPMDGFTMPDGSLAPPSRNMMTLVFVHRAGRWLLTEGHNTIIDPQAAMHDPGK